MDDHKNMVIVSLKTLPVKSNGTKPGWRKKECNIFILVFFPSCRYDYDFFNTSTSRSLNLRIPMLHLNFLNVVKCNTFVNKFARLLNEQFCWISILPFSWSLSVEEFGKDILSYITFYESSFNLCNTNYIISI